MASKSNTNCARQQAQCYWGRCAFRGQAREEHLRERGLCSLVRCLQRGEDPACGQGKQGGQQTGAPGRERNGAPGVLIWRADATRSGVGVAIAGGTCTCLIRVSDADRWQRADVTCRSFAGGICVRISHNPQC